ncbi:hypothetical protein B0J13DRAFT_573104 [Dactylonectria estremocensis]|uniref:Uncharacterized protein n=1 Tax=Dactylonectria estremocensis TaxID=1079267 RepID=A0A9P9D8Q2_9HYPO|nr:hypothetical protein B0J13DRAFT_573104 [Dactylonectria estremocensis]
MDQADGIVLTIKEQYTGPVGHIAVLTSLCKTIITLTGRNKSQVAIQFAHHIRNTSPQTSIF